MKLPLRYTGATTLDADGIPCDKATAPFYDSPDPIRRMERASIRWWMEKQREYLKGRVLDFGAGAQPYRGLVDGVYTAIEKGDKLPREDVQFDAVMLNQVMQYLTDPWFTLHSARQWLRLGGHLVMTYATNWEECEAGDMFRFTKTGMAELLRAAEFSKIVTHDLRAECRVGNFSFPLGYGVVCQR